MNNLIINSLSFSYPGRIILDDFSIQFEQGWTCVAGANGVGKSTLLNLITGNLSPSSGSISFSGDAVYCAQKTEELEQSAYSAYWNGDSSVRRLFSMLKIKDSQFERWETLSGGEKKRIQIACALAESPSVLILDEPTNHLDEESSDLILRVLKEYSGIGIVVSHSRSFADALCSSTLFLYADFSDGMQNAVRAKKYPAGLSDALKIRESEKKSALKDWNEKRSAVQSEKERCRKWQLESERSASRLSRANCAGDSNMRGKINLAKVSGKDKTAGNTKHNFESRLAHSEKILSETERPGRRKEGFSIQTETARKGILAHLDAQEIIVGNPSEGNEYTLSIPSITIRSETRTALTGNNGAGKTTLIKRILQAAGNVRTMYIPQEIPECDARKILSDFAALDEKTKGEVVSTLYRLGSEPEALIAEGESVSPGELRKLCIALSLTSPVELIVLDEPTNHLDIVSVMALEEALKNASCAMILVSHDRVFLENICTQFWHIERNGNYGVTKI